MSTHEGKVALVTGGKQGIGRGIANLPAARGAKVVIVNREAADADAAEIGKLSDKVTRVLAVGAAGKFAGLVVPALVARGSVVRGLTSDPGHVQRARDNGAHEVLVGDLADVSSLTDALADIDSVFYIAPVFAPDEIKLGKNLIEAAGRCGVRRVVFSSVIHPILNTLENHAAKAAVEEAILASGLEYTLLHPAVFFQNYAEAWPVITKSGTLAEPYSADKRLTRVDYRDVAEVAAIALTEDRLLNGTFELCAEGDLNRHDVAGMIGKVLGRPIRAEAPAFADWAQKAHVPEGGPVRPGLEAMFAWYDRHGLVGNALTLRAILGREPRSLEGYFRELAAADAS